MAGGSMSTSTGGKSIATSILLCSLYIAASAILINFNKQILKSFPYPWELTSMHMSCSSIMSLCLYTGFPSLFPAMERVRDRKLELLRYFVPLGAFFAVALFASNKAYLYCSVAFLQFMKESNVVLIFLLCCTVGLQIMDRMKALVVLWVLLGSSMCVQGEMSFSMVGFMIQATSQVAECCKNVLGEYIMSGTDFKLDPLTYTMFMAPMTICFLSLGVMYTWEAVVVDAVVANWHLLLPNAMLAYALNLIIANVLKHCSSMGFILAGMVKDIVIVVVSSHLFGDIITTNQYIGFAVTLGGCAVWSILKLDPDGPVADSLRWITCSERPTKDEKMSILADKSEKA